MNYNYISLSEVLLLPVVQVLAATLAGDELRELLCSAAAHLLNQMPRIFIQGCLIAEYPTISGNLRLMYDRGPLVSRRPLFAGVDQAVDDLPPLLCEGSRAFLGGGAERRVRGGIQRGVARQRRLHSVELRVGRMDQADREGRDQG